MSEAKNTALVGTVDFGYCDGSPATNQPRPPPLPWSPPPSFSPPLWSSPPSTARLTAPTA